VEPEAENSKLGFRICLRFRVLDIYDLACELFHSIEKGFDILAQHIVVVAAL